MTQVRGEDVTLGSSPFADKRLREGIPPEITEGLIMCICVYVRVHIKQNATTATVIAIESCFIINLRDLRA